MRSRPEAPAAPPPRSRWHELADRFPVRPIRTEADYLAGDAVMRDLLAVGRTVEEDDYLEVLSDLLADYEDDRHEIDPATPGDVLRSLIEEKGVTQAEVSAATGIAEANLSAMLADRRGIGRATRARLAAYFGVKPDRFLVE